MKQPWQKKPGSNERARTIINDDARTTSANNSGEADRGTGRTNEADKVPSHTLPPSWPVHSSDAAGEPVTPQIDALMS